MEAFLSALEFIVWDSIPVSVTSPQKMLSLLKKIPSRSHEPSTYRDKPSTVEPYRSLDNLPVILAANTQRQCYLLNGLQKAESKQTHPELSS